MDSGPLIQITGDFGIGYQTAIAKTESSMVLRKGTHHVLARNGRGKTTLLKTLGGILKAKHGSCQLSGHVQYLPENLYFDPLLTAKVIFQSLAGRSNRSLAGELARQADLDLHKPYGKLSTGNRRKVALILTECAVRGKRGDILLLDEPLSGVDAHVRAVFERYWESTGDVLRVVSCHPDYDEMPIPSAVLIDEGAIVHQEANGQTWCAIKRFSKP